ncbi:hypothetical protein HD806DRAFT_547364 [Xylariaceae sp. AK1471]|nr:hypothetical protein HD806DRAFT_547364 [Xylariaceae sp. AK1471]
MQWNSTSNGGFCPAEVKPWMRVNDDYTVVNAAIQVSAGRADGRSMLVPPYRFWQQSIELRKRHVDLKCNLEESITILNFSRKEADFTLPVGLKVQFWALGSYDASSTEKPRMGTMHLLPWEGLLGICARGRTVS